MLDSIKITLKDAKRVLFQKEITVWRWKSPTGVFGVPWFSIRWGRGAGIRFPSNPRNMIQRAKAAL